MSAGTVLGNLVHLLNFIKALSRTQKRNIMLAVDLILVPVAMVFAFSLQVSPMMAQQVALQNMPVLAALLVVSVLVSIWLGVCAIQLSAYDATSIGTTAIFASILGAASFGLSSLFGPALPFGTHVVFALSFLVLSVVVRALMLKVVQAAYRRSKDAIRVLIYGAGATGTQLVSALRNHKSIMPVAFLDDNAAMHGMTLSHLPVHSPVRLHHIVEKMRIDRVLLAMPSLSQPRQMQIAHRLQEQGLEVQAVPSFAQLIGEDTLIDQLTSLEPNAFLNRDEMSETFDDSRSNYTDRNVLVTGAGGSIGSELCRQILECRPAKLVLFELSELALFRIDMELAQIVEKAQITIVPILGSVTDARQVRKLLQDHDIQVVLHAAAYKHVPLVEANPLSGLANNVLGTQTIAQEAVAAGVERFMLISSDKAVRPTNVMGASKRLAELVVQDLATRANPPSAGNAGTVLSMVRFGNVLGSSGSVVPLFQDQLRRGGPLTVTHPNVARFFMTVQEAVTLVLRAGAMAEGGEVFVLDMGKPVPIERLARQIIESGGYTVRDKANPDGDIEIAFTGLRPGEKMMEELTLSGNLLGTGHCKIFYSDEAQLSEIEVATATRALRQAMVNGDEDAARDVARRWVEGYGSTPAIPPFSGYTTITPVT
ncbi:nucleoside-diphosphate sugar epimerase/dehydratase [Ascidiaceihabitans sp.]|uniref:polysaccharide biosynthesis protein n=1 Tax=Ascidiaceihabitans sp. TaxID=1872644 RepID=UPI00329813D2